jgi:hypothetical protein
MGDTFIFLLIPASKQLYEAATILSILQGNKTDTEIKGFAWVQPNCMWQSQDLTPKPLLITSNTSLSSYTIFNVSIEQTSIIDADLCNILLCAI